METDATQWRQKSLFSSKPRDFCQRSLRGCRGSQWCAPPSGWCCSSHRAQFHGGTLGSLSPANVSNLYLSPEKKISVQLVLLSCNWCHLNISRLTLSAMWGRYLKKANSQLTKSVAGQENICEISNVAGFRKREQVYVFCFAVRHDENPISTFVQERDFLSFNQLKLLYFPILGPFPVQGEFFLFFLLMALALACL